MDPPIDHDMGGRWMLDARGHALWFVDSDSSSKSGFPDPLRFDSDGVDDIDIFG
jgi:hypothetical protein